ncbi:MAG: hypothetical protein QXX20_02835 [Candidatus Thermoplasmatota archaeon]
MMKKVWATIIMCMLVSLGVFAVVTAQKESWMKSNTLSTATSMPQGKKCGIPLSPIALNDDASELDDLELLINNQELEQNRYRYETKSMQIKPKVVEGTWGYLNDLEPRGTISGVIGRKHKLGILKAEFATYDNTTNGKILGIFKKGFFNGKILLPNDEPKRITGLYTVDTESQTASIQWMTIELFGWADIHLCD